MVTCDRQSAMTDYHRCHLQILITMDTTGVFRAASPQLGYQWTPVHQVKPDMCWPVEVTGADLLRYYDCKVMLTIVHYLQLYQRVSLQLITHCSLICMIIR